MELKFAYHLQNVYCYGCFNRTFMELKSFHAENFLSLVFSFNRTFMELKLSGRTLYEQSLPF